MNPERPWEGFACAADCDSGFACWAVTDTARQTTSKKTKLGLSIRLKIRGDKTVVNSTPRVQASLPAYAWSAAASKDARHSQAYNFSDTDLLCRNSNR